MSTSRPSVRPSVCPSVGRVAMVSEHASPLAALGGPDAGGQNVYVAQLAGRLVRRGHEVIVYTRRDDPRLPQRVTTTDGYQVVHVPAGPAAPLPKDELPPYIPQFGDFLAREWAARPPDVVHAHFWMSGWAALVGARGLGVPVVQTYHALGSVKKRHQGAADTSPPDRVAIETAIGRECSRTIATCEDEVAELEAMGLSRRNISVVPCGVDPLQFAPASASGGSVSGGLASGGSVSGGSGSGGFASGGSVPGESMSGGFASGGSASGGSASGESVSGGFASGRSASAPRRLLAVGRLVPRKGFDRAIRALADVPDAELLIAGGPEPALLLAEPEAERLRALADEWGVADRVTLLGGVSRERMPGLMSSADLLLSLPRYEPFGIVPVEAMSCRVPVLATAVGGQLDTVVDGLTGVLVPADDNHDISGTIRRLLAAPDLLARYGAAGRRRVLARYTWDRVAEGVTRAYSAVSSVPSLSGALP